jgi:hypothetical protein
MKKLVLLLALFAFTSCEKDEPVKVCECRFEGVDEYDAGRDDWFIDTDITDCSRQGERRDIGTVDTGFYLILQCK